MVGMRRGSSVGKFAGDPQVHKEGLEAILCVVWS